MAFSDVALLARDNDFLLRITACASQEGEIDPQTWANEHMWRMAGMPDFGDKYAYALANGVTRPGNDQSVISDHDILAAVQSLMESADE